MANFLNGVWLLEDKGGWVDNPENVNTASFTAEGTDYWVAEYADLEDAPDFVADYEDIPEWSSIDMSIGEGHDLVKITGTYQGATFAATIAKKHMLKKFFRNHSVLDDEVFYLVKRWDTNSYELWYDNNRTERKYMQCKFESAPKTSIKERVLHFSMTIRSCW